VKYDLALFEQLNDEYRDRPIHALAPLAERQKILSPTADDQQVVTQAERQRYAADKQLKPILRDIDLAGKVVLELGCGHGWLTSILPEQGQVARAIGVDVQEFSSWDEHTDPRVSFVVSDLSQERIFQPESIDAIISQVVFEHVSRPLQMLQALYDLLKFGGQAWLRMNVYTARNASHKYREVFFPWPHLLFDDDVLAAYYAKHHGIEKQKFAWVNHLTVAHYLYAARQVGFDISHVRRWVAPIDVEFYLRFEDKLGRYQALDLETDFLLLVLQKNTVPAEEYAAPIASIDYVGRQQELERAIRAHKGEQRKQAASDPPSGQNLNTADHWDEIYRVEWESGQVQDPKYARDYGPMHDAIISLIPDTSRVLDAGCGSGVLSRKIKRRLPDTSVIGVDLSPYTITRNQQADVGLGIEYACLDIRTSLPSLDRRFDVITMIEVLEHLDQPERVVADAMRLLEPGGLFILTCPHDDAIPHATHVRQWGHDELYHLLEDYSESVSFKKLPLSHRKWILVSVVKAAYASIQPSDRVLGADADAPDDGVAQDLCMSL
jgi:2-polyprenyl-3-methyl-5-hydroxy-6-metoxy-1,4-benzoquinol methylase